MQENKWGLCRENSHNGGAVQLLWMSASKSLESSSYHKSDLVVELGLWGLSNVKTLKFTKFNHHTSTLQTVELPSFISICKYKGLSHLLFTPQKFSNWVVQHKFWSKLERVCYITSCFRVSLHFFKLINLFISGCVGSSLLCVGFL